MSVPAGVHSMHPIKLKAILAKHKISQRSLCPGIIQSRGRAAGKPISPAVLNQIVNMDYWASMTPPQEIKDQVESILLEKGVSKFELKDAWEIDTKADFTSQQVETAANRPPGRWVSKKSASDTPPIASLNLPEPAMLSEKARRHFKLFKHPFVDDVQGPHDVYLSTEQRYIRETMFQAAKHGGFVAIVGESGSGKTTLRRDLLDRIRRDNEPIRAIQPQVFDKTRLTAAHICDAIIDDLGHAGSPRSLEHKARMVSSLLIESSRAGNRHALIIEEAHDLHISTLKYLKRFWELEDGFRKLIAIIMVGQSELGDRLDERRNPQAREVIRRCEVAVLQPLNGNLEEYLAMKLKRCGRELDQVFDGEAFDAMRDRLTLRRRHDNSTTSYLYPLVVHNVCIKAMNQAAEIGEAKVTADLIRGV